MPIEENPEFDPEDMKYADCLDPEWRTLCCSVPVFHYPGYELSGRRGGSACLKCGQRFWDMTGHVYFVNKPDDWDTAVATLKFMAP